MLGLKWAGSLRDDYLPDILTKNHSDYPPGLRRIKRKKTSWLGLPPKKWFGSATVFRVWYFYAGELLHRTDPTIVGDGQNYLMYEHPLPIPADGQWWFGWPFYFAITTKGGTHFRIGFRWDDIDCYYSISIAFKKIKRSK